jgi:hypothetical protein
MLSVNLNFEINHPESGSLSWENTGQYIGSSYILLTSLLIIKDPLEHETPLSAFLTFL